MGVLGAAKLSLEQSADNCSSENLAQEALANNVAHKKGIHSQPT
jgi:hypothetical protein